jgi:hypothetical protein
VFESDVDAEVGQTVHDAGAGRCVSVIAERCVKGPERDGVAVGDEILDGEGGTREARPDSGVG